MKQARTTRRSFQQEVSEAIATVTEIQSRVSDNDTYAVIAFDAAGYDAATIYPRVTVLTFEAWKAYGRHVTKGAKAVHVPVWKPRREKTDSGWQVVTHTSKSGEEKALMVQTTAYLFHVSQTAAYTPDELEKLTKGATVPAFLPMTREQLAALAAAPCMEDTAKDDTPAAIEPETDTPEEIAADDRRVAAGRDRFAGGHRSPGVLPLFA
jgi:hypothetical protein